VNHPQIAQTAPVNRKSAPKSVYQKEKREKKLAGFWPDSGKIWQESGGVSLESLLTRVFGVNSENMNVKCYSGHVRRT
jgi:hypothetical protein